MTYVERLVPPPSLFAAVWGFALALGVSFYAALGPVAFGVALLGPGLAGTVLLVSTVAEVRVANGQVSAGLARIPVTALGPARPLDAEQAKRVRGPESDPAGYHLIRGWIRCGVLAEVVDPTDPTPYWFLSSRDPQRLATAIEAARRAAGRA